MKEERETKIRTLSDTASRIDTSARALVDFMNSRHHEGMMPHDVAENIYRSRVCELAIERMREEMEPYQKIATRHYSIRIRPHEDDLPEGLRAAMEKITSKWRNVYEELMGDPLKTD